jgi:hypothetical protein
VLATAPTTARRGFRLAPTAAAKPRVATRSRARSGGPVLRGRRAAIWRLRSGG